MASSPKFKTRRRAPTYEFEERFCVGKMEVHFETKRHLPATTNSFTCEFEVQEQSGVAGLIDFFQHCTMSQSNIFGSWQTRFHLANSQSRNAQDGQVPDEDSNRQFQSQGLSIDSQNPHWTSNEDFDRLMLDPLPRRLFHGETTEPLMRSPSRMPSLPTMPLESSSIMFAGPAPTPPTSVKEIDVEPIGAEKGKKRKNAPSKKPKKAKKVVQLLSDDSDDSDEAIPRNLWKDAEVVQLIAFRHEMDEEFERNAKKQGQNTWEKLQERMIVACDGFSKSPEACRKKWVIVYRAYNQDKRRLMISGEGRKITCKFFDEIDEGFNNRANVRKFAHGDAHDTANPCPPDLNEDAEGIGSPEGGYPIGCGQDSCIVYEVPDEKFPIENVVASHQVPVYVKYYKVVRVDIFGTPM